jgi:hypothetical protein
VIYFNAAFGFLPENDNPGLIQTRMAQSQLLWVKAGAHELRKRPERDVGAVTLLLYGSGLCGVLCMCKALKFKLELIYKLIWHKE